MEIWKVFYNRTTGERLAAYTLAEEFQGEEEDTRNLTAQDHGITPAEIETRIEDGDGNELFMIKANIPKTPEEYEAGNGEGAFFLIDAEAMDAYNADQSGREYGAILWNDSWNWPELRHGTRATLEMRGAERPVVSYNVLSRYKV